MIRRKSPQFKVLMKVVTTVSGEAHLNLHGVDDWSPASQLDMFGQLSDRMREWNPKVMSAETKSLPSLLEVDFGEDAFRLLDFQLRPLLPSEIDIMPANFGLKPEFGQVSFLALEKDKQSDVLSFQEAIRKAFVRHRVKNYSEKLHNVYHESRVRNPGKFAGAGAARRAAIFNLVALARRAAIFNFVAPARRGAPKISNLAALRGAALLGAPLTVMRQSKIKFFPEVTLVQNLYVWKGL